MIEILFAAVGTKYKHEETDFNYYVHTFIVTD